MKTVYTNSWSALRQVHRLKMIVSMVIFLSLGLSFNSNAQLGIIQVGSGTTTISSSTGVLATNYNFNYSQQIITSSEYFGAGGAIGNITKIRYYTTNIGTLTNWNDWTVYIANTTKTSFASTTDWVPVAQMTQVFSGLITAVNNTWFEITFTTPFNYTGGNIVVAVDENTPGNTAVPTFRSYTSSAITAIYYRNDTTNPDPTAPPTASTITAAVPQIQFQGTLAACPPPMSILLNGLTDNSATIGWTANGPATSWEIELGAAGFTPTGVATQTVNTNSVIFSSLPPSTSYQYYIRSFCSGTSQSIWVGPYSFATTQVPAIVPFLDDFSTNQWSTINGTQINKWFVGAGAGNPVDGLYISNDNGVSNTYTVTTASITKAYRDILFPISSNPFNFRFDWKATGHGTTNDVMRIWMVPTSSVITEGVLTSAANTPGAVLIGTTFNGVLSWTTSNYVLAAATYSGTSKRLVFEWRNDTSLGTQNPAAVDNVQISIITCTAPTTPTANTITQTSANLAWSASVTIPEFDVEWGITGFTPTGIPTIASTLNPTPLTSLTAGTTYDYYVRSACSSSNKSIWVGPFTFSTLQVPATLPFTDDFSTSQWTVVNGTQFNKWVIGAAAGNPANGLYISEDNGTANTYNVIFTSIAKAYREVEFPVSTNAFNLSFDWKANGQTTVDYFRVWMVPATATITAGVQISTSNTPGAIQIGANLNLSTDWATAYFILPAATYSGTTKRLVFEWRNDASTGNQSPAAIDNVNMHIITCPSPTALTATNITTTTADLAWVENGTATAWEIQYGLGSFVPNTGPSLSASTNPFTVTGLQPSSSYRFYVRTRCSATDSSMWAGPYQVLTSCGPISVLPWTENFDLMPTLATGLFPYCWVDENPGVWASTNAVLSTTTAGPLSGPNNIRIRYSSNATIWTPEFALVAGQSYSFTFSFAGDTRNSWDGSVYVNGSQSIIGATMLGAKFVEVGDPTSFTYEEVEYCFTPTTSGTYTFGVKVIENASNWYMSFDDFKLKQVFPVTGVDGSLSACLIGLPVDLNAVITTTSTDGTWNFGLNPNAVDTAGFFNTASVPAGVHQFLYITAGCAPDTTIATITVVKPSSAGNDGSLVVCRNQPFNLLQGLTGYIDYAGVWIDPNSTVVPNGNTVASNIPGQYNFRYTVSNGVCPADTSKVIVTVQGSCDYLGLDDATFEAFNMYPNPTSDVLFITNTGSTEVFNYEVLDMNGRVILKENNAINGSTTTELNLGKVEIGVYLIRVFNDKSEKTFRVVKN